MMGQTTNAMEIAVLSNLIENIGSGIDPAMLSGILASISTNSDKIDVNMMGVSAAGISVAMLSDNSAMMMMNVDMNSD